MKRYIVSLFSIILLVVLNSCQTDNITSPTNKEPFVNPYSKVGKLHNEGLDYILSKIESSRELFKYKNHKLIKSKDEILNFITNSGLEFIKKKNLGKYTKTAFLEYSQKNLYKTNSDVEDSLTDLQKKYLNDINYITETVKDTIKLKVSLNDLENNAYNVLGEEDSRVILIASSVAYSSTTYWARNFNKWKQAIIDTSNLQKTNNINTLKEIAAADVAGAVVGAMTAWWTGPGIAVAAAAGALIASAYQAAIDILYFLGLG
ncbi:MAG TPA: hypothetical protein ENI61_04005 [Ignavibacteria bacterium]|nr:hypothetical protein [Ignavibacteria bacterium]